MTDTGPADSASSSAPAGAAAVAGPVVAILADDLIWAQRLSDAVAAAGGTPARRRRVEDLGTAAAAFVIVDLTARAYEGVEAVRQSAVSGARVVAVGQHDDAALRRAALDAGAERVFTYRALFEDGPRQLARWLGR